MVSVEKLLLIQVNIFRSKESRQDKEKRTRKTIKHQHLFQFNATSMTPNDDSETSRFLRRMLVLFLEIW